MKTSAASLVLGFVILAATNAGAAQHWLRLSWTGPTHTSITITWTDDTTGSGQVEVRPVGGNSTIVAATAADTGSADLGATYTATVTGLQPNTDYEYRVTSGGSSSGFKAFRTAPPPGSCDAIHFIAGGDSRGEVLGVYFPSLQWPKVVGFAVNEHPLFFLHSGDFVHDGDQTGQWAKEMPTLESLSSVSPFFSIMGNHDDGPGQGPAANFNMLFNNPANGTDAVDDYYSFVAGNILVVGLSTYTYSIDTQTAWLQQVLEANKNTVDWRVLVFHTPVWSSGAHGSDENDQLHAAQLVPLLDQYGVELVVNGHDHDYERFHPSKGGYGGVPRVFTPLSDDNGTRGIPQGTSYIVSGGGGALENIAFVPHEVGYAKGSAHLNYLVIDVVAGTMTIKAVDCGVLGISGADCSTIIETVTLLKDTTVCTGGQTDGGDGGPADGGDAGLDGGPDAGADAADAGRDAGFDAGADPGQDGNLADAGLGDDGTSPTDNPSSDNGPLSDQNPGGDPGKSAGGCGCGGSVASIDVFSLGLLALLVARRRR